MDGNVHPVSPSELYGRLGTASAPSLVDVRRDGAFNEDDRLIIGAYHRPPADVSRWLSELPTERRSLLQSWPRGEPGGGRIALCGRRRCDVPGRRCFRLDRERITDAQKAGCRRAMLAAIFASIALALTGLVGLAGH